MSSTNFVKISGTKIFIDDAITLRLSLTNWSKEDTEFFIKIPNFLPGNTNKVYTNNNNKIQIIKPSKKHHQVRIENQQSNLKKRMGGNPIQNQVGRG